MARENKVVENGLSERTKAFFSQGWGFSDPDPHGKFDRRAERKPTHLFFRLSRRSHKTPATSVNFDRLFRNIVWLKISSLSYEGYGRSTVTKIIGILK